jgi:hypothetical protein
MSVVRYCDLCGEPIPEGATPEVAGVYRAGNGKTIQVVLNVAPLSARDVCQPCAVQGLVQVYEQGCSTRKKEVPCPKS